MGSPGVDMRSRCRVQANFLSCNNKLVNSPQNAIISSVSVLQITTERTESLVEGEHFGNFIPKYDWLG